MITVCPSTWLHFQIKFILRSWSMDISFHQWALSNWRLRRMVMLNAYSISNVNSPLNILQFWFQVRNLKISRYNCNYTFTYGNGNLSFDVGNGTNCHRIESPKTNQEVILHFGTWSKQTKYCDMDYVLFHVYRYNFGCGKKDTENDMYFSLANFDYWVIWCESFGNQIRLIIKRFFYCAFFPFSLLQSR